MKLKPTILLATFVITMGLLLGTSAAQERPVVQTDANANVITILNLPVIDSQGGTIVYDVDFVNGPLSSVYPDVGPGPDDGFPFNTVADAFLALYEVNMTLNSSPSFPPPGASSEGTDQFFIPIEDQDPATLSIGSENFFIWDICRTGCVDGTNTLLNSTPATYLVFSPAAGEPPPEDPEPLVADAGGERDAYSVKLYTGTAGVAVTFDGTGSSGSIATYYWDIGEDPIGGEFPTGPTPSHTYNVAGRYFGRLTVTDNTGRFDTDDITVFIRSDSQPVSKVAAEGQTLPDGTVLKSILLDGGVAIDFFGRVAFGGRDDAGTDAAFTQARKVVAEGETLPDGTILAAFRGQGEVAISAGWSPPRVAFHGQVESGPTDTAAVFTQAGKVATEGETLSAGVTVDEIDPAGKVAINNWGQVAFHGKVEIEADPTDQQLRVVFISDGLETRVAAQEASPLPDGTPLDDITESGGVAINDFEEVAFHGQTVDPDAGGDLVKAVFTSDKLVAKEGDTLPDGILLDDIEVNGGVAINFFGEVAFHGDAIDPAVGGDSVKAVFISDGETIQVVAKEGDILPDGTPLAEIEVSAGVAINILGDVAFHGRTGGVKAVFTQAGLVAMVGDTVFTQATQANLVAMVGDNLADGTGTTLNEIWDTAGVAINPYGFQVAFHGKVGNTDAVFVGSAP